MTATATHDTKRGEDARARLMALAELPGEWASAVGRWKILNAPHLVVDGDMRAPSATFEYMLYQALLGVWPVASQRRCLCRAHAGLCLKAAREGKQETTWFNPDAALRGRVESLNRAPSGSLRPRQNSGFNRTVFGQRFSLFGALNRLARSR